VIIFQENKTKNSIIAKEEQDVLDAQRRYDEVNADFNKWENKHPAYKARNGPWITVVQLGAQSLGMQENPYGAAKPHVCIKDLYFRSDWIFMILTVSWLMCRTIDPRLIQGLRTRILLLRWDTWLFINNETIIETASIPSIVEKLLKSVYDRHQFIFQFLNFRQ